jgi:hypothetical protein
VPLASFKFPYFLVPLFLQHPFWGSADVHAFRVEVNRAWEAARVVAVLTVETSA